jgi:hypothetical protein
MPMPTFPLAQLGQFRSELHACFPCRADALFELGDALLCAPAPSRRCQAVTIPACSAVEASVLPDHASSRKATEKPVLP